MSLLVSLYKSLLLAPTATEIYWPPSADCRVVDTWTKRRDHWKRTELIISLNIVQPLWNLPYFWKHNNLTSRNLIMNLKIRGFFEKLVLTQPINEFHSSLFYWEVSTMCLQNESVFLSAMLSKRLWQVHFNITFWSENITPQSPLPFPAPSLNFYAHLHKVWYNYFTLFY